MRPAAILSSKGFAFTDLYRKTFLLFGLNLLDAILTIIWVRTGIATEGNQLMARLLEIGDYTFLTVKVAIGLTVAAVILRAGNVLLARLGLGFALCVYLSLMGVHIFTGLVALGVVPHRVIRELAGISSIISSILS